MPATGFSVAGQCVAQRAEALTSFCSNYGGPTASGVVSCDFFTDQNGPFYIRQVLVTPTGTRSESFQLIPGLLPCDAFAGVTPAELLSVVSWGFGFVLAMWALGWGVGVAKSFIRKI